MVYLVFGLAWIALSDRALLLMVDDVTLLGQLQTLKGWGYVILTAIVLFLLIYYPLRARDRASREACRLTGIVERSPVVAIEWATTPGWPVTFVSPNIARWGIDRHALLSGETNYADLIHPEDIDRIVTDVAAHIDRGPDRYTQLYRLRSREGSWIWLEDRTWLTRNEAGRVTRIHGLLLDVTERLRAEQDLRDSETRFRAIFDNVQEAILLQDLDTEALIGANAAAEQMYGYSRAELLACSVDELSADESGFDVQRQKALMERARRGEQLVFEWRARHRDGHGFWVEANLQATEIAGERLLLVTLRNIEARKQAEAALARQVDRLSQAERHAGLGSWEYLLETREMWWSDRLYGLLGCDARSGTPTLESFARDFFDLDSEDGASFADAMEALLKGGRPGPRRLLLKARPEVRGEAWFSITMEAPIERPDGMHYVQGTVLEVTELKRNELELRDLNATLEQRVAERTAALQALNQELESFSYAVSHDLKAPLRGIEGYSQLLEADYGEQLEGEGRTFVRNIRQGVAQMNELISDLLAYSRMERRPLEEREVRVRALVEEVLESVDPALRERAEVTLEVDPGLVFQSDPDGVALILRNLLENAFKFSAERETPQVTVQAQSRSATLGISIRDNGIGFDMAFQDRIFDIFQRLNRAEAYPGTGVGLALVRRAVNRLGGEIRAEGTPGEGASFHVEFPR
ncbi:MULTISPECIES: PAS domain S-box protein [unclassified Thioalkalivibrio]|uniref:PAS domain-containing sensor histidine kinase n=1 Tax=unclassified Thioalkalivibrio TaxID=2621013 RepID=UPI000475EF71|nr:MULTISPECIES: PAS domain S-box protein [unclassified Thioalkalivibrio]